MSAIDDALAANRTFSETFDRGNVPSPPAKHLAVVTCMDSRIQVEDILGLAPGDAHVIRNAGGHASDDAIRSLIISSFLLGTNEIMVIQHRDCGMLKSSNEQIGRLVQEKTGAATEGMDFGAMTDLDESVEQSVQRIRESPYLSRDITVRGFIYDVHTGALEPVA